VACRLYGREGYHAVFLKPPAKALWIRGAGLHVALPQIRRGEAGGYVEEPWLYEAEGEAPEPPAGCQASW